MKMMSRPIALFGLIAMCLSGCALTNPYLGTCGKTPNLEVVSLAMFPDPLPEARKIDQWRAIVRSDSAEICQTTLAIVEEGKSQAITQERKVELTLGANEILFTSIDTYRMNGNRICFEITGYLDGNKTAIKSPRRFCARTIDKGLWSMR
jgi:hypothetical protein